MPSLKYSDRFGPGQCGFEWDNHLIGSQTKQDDTQDQLMIQSKYSW